MSNSQYGADEITVLEGLEAVRKRPGMYIGNTGVEGLHSCLREILDNSVDEFMAGHASTMKVYLDEKGFAYVADDGRGIPTDIHSKTGKTALETILTVLHAGGKFNQDNYQFSGGLHGVGASVVNALSQTMEVWVKRGDNFHYMSFSKGKVTSEMITMTKDEFVIKHALVADLAVWNESGTIISFSPDGSIFETVDFNYKEIQNRLQQMAYLNKGLKIILQKAGEDELTYCYPEGIKTYLEDICGKEVLVTPIIHFEATETNFVMETAFAYGTDFNEKLYAFTNGIINPEGGAHVTGFKTALTKLINQYALTRNIFKKEEKFSSDDLREGLRVVLSVKMADPQFTSQAKVKLGSTIARTIVDRMLTEKLGTYLEENPVVLNSIINKGLLAMKARLAAKAARESVIRKGALESTALPGKLADCSNKNPEDSEIFIVEGDSAGGSAKQGRDRHSQAILPLRGKVLNTEKATLDRILNYEGIKNMVIAFGTGIGNQYDVTKLRYHKIILMTDADVDGAHITTLLLTFFYRYMKDLIEQGYVYMACPPLYRIAYGKKVEYVYSDAEKEVLLKSIQAEYGITTVKEVDIDVQEDQIEEIISEDVDEVAQTKTKKAPKIEIQRYKGLGEMNPEQLWNTTMDPAKRMLWQVTIGEAAVANQVFEDLMGADVDPRRKFIEDNAVFAEVDLV
jgi:DNA gyrase subunit B